MFGFTTNFDGSVQVMQPQNEENNINITAPTKNKQIINKQKILQRIQDENPNSRLTTQQLKALYDDFNDDGLIMF